MRTRNSTYLLIIVLFAAACSEAVQPPDDSPSPDTSTDTRVMETDEKADHTEELRVRAAGMTLWAEPVVETIRGDWILEARSSYDIAAVTASLDGAEVAARTISARKFEVTLDARQMAANLEGAPLLVSVATTSGLIRTAMFGTRATFGYSAGSAKIYPWKNLLPVIAGGDTVFRGRLTTRGEFDQVVGRNDDDSEPTMRREDPTHWMADFPTYALPWAASPTEDPVVFIAEDSDGNRYERDVHIVVEVNQLGITSKDPTAAWPAPTCTEEVRSCVTTLGASADLERCGLAAEVRPCLSEVPQDNTAELVDLFFSGLQRAIINHYAVHGPDIEASGGNTQQQALRSLDSADIEEVLDPEENPSGYNLDTHRVFRHPDVVFPGSDIVWFGVVERSTSELVDVFDFN